MVEISIKFAYESNTISHGKYQKSNILDLKENMLIWIQKFN